MIDLPLALWQPLFAHGLAVERSDIPIPIAAFYAGAVAVLVVSFTVLAIRRTSAPASTEVRPAPAWLNRLARARASRVMLSGLGIAWLLGTLGTLIGGSTDAADNAGPSLVFAIGWLGWILLALALGSSVRRVHPIRTLCLIGGMRDTTLRPLSPRVGVWPAAGGLAIFVWLELVFPTSTHVRLLAVLVVIWLLGITFSCSRWGVRNGIERIDPFGTSGRLFASLAPFSWRTDGRLGIRLPLMHANRDIAPQSGLVALTILLISSISFDGLSRTAWWLRRTTTASADLAANGWSLELSRVLFGTFGLIMLTATMWVAFEIAAALTARILRSTGNPAPAGRLFAPSLMPIAAGYVIAHYCSFFLLQTQDLARHASDPFGTGADLFSTAGLTVYDYWRPDGLLTWMIQVGAIVIGHVAALILAHDRTLELARDDTDTEPDMFRTTLAQIPMLTLMVLLTIGGLYFLSEGLV